MLKEAQKPLPVTVWEKIFHRMISFLLIKRQMTYLAFLKSRFVLVDPAIKS